jgi:flagellar M-ring protein FliF
MATAAATVQSGNFATQSGNGSPLATTGGAMSTLGMPDQGAGNYGALPLLPSGPFGAVKQILNQPAVKKTLPLMVIALTLLAFALFYTLMNAPAYRSVMSGVTESDQQAAFEALKQGEFKPVIDTSNGQITVPATRYHEARLFLASKGLPKTAQAGIDSLKDQSAMTTSQFMEQVRYNAAMEQELARSITQIDSIQTARVHLAVTKPSVFVRDRTPPKASVVVTPFAGRTVSPMQVQALVHLVASSIPMLTPENVTVVDNNGKMITDTASDTAMGMNAGQTKHKQSLEDLYRQRVIQILAPIVGEANVRSQVNLTLDFSQTETTVEDFDTRDKGPKTRSEVVSEDRNSAKEAGGVPGTLSNTAPAQPTTTLNTAATPAPAKGGDERSTIAARSTRNYELDRSVRHTKSATGAIERLSVAVVVNERTPLVQPKNDKGEAVEPKPNPFTPEEVERMQELVRGVVGYSEDREDVVTVVQARFEPEPVLDLTVAWYKDESLMNNIKSGLLGLVFISFLMVVVRPVVSHLMNRDKLAAQEAASIQIAQAEALAIGLEAPVDPGSVDMGEGETLEQMKAKLKPKKSNISMEMLDTANTYDDKVALVRMIVAEDSARVANVLKGMIRPA